MAQRPEDRRLDPAETVRPTPLVGIYNETDRLRRAAVWGPLGAEAILAQVYAKSVSLYSGEMNVPIAREESFAFERVLERRGVEVTRVRDKLAMLLPPPAEPLDKETIITQITQKAWDVREAKWPKYSPRGSLQDSPWYKSAIGLFADRTSAIRTLVEEDIVEYGEQRALELNRVLCLEPELPMGNVIYARDQMNVLLGTRFKSAMTKPIRIPEVALYEAVYQTGMGLPPAAIMPDGETFEGGDAYVHNGIVYVGVGIRTTRGAAEFIYRTLRPQLEERGMQFAIVEERHPETRSPRDKMDFMHLDTFSGAIGDTEIAVCADEAARRNVSYLKTGSDGSVITDDSGENFLNHLRRRESLVIEIPRSEQETFGCNFLALDDHTLLLPLDCNEKTNDQFRAAGKELVFLGLQESTHGYGASHCMTGQLVRAK